MYWPTYKLMMFFFTEPWSKYQMSKVCQFSIKKQWSGKRGLLRTSSLKNTYSQAVLSYDKFYRSNVPTYNHPENFGRRNKSRIDHFFWGGYTVFYFCNTIFTSLCYKEIRQNNLPQFKNWWLYSLNLQFLDSN